MSMASPQNDTETLEKMGECKVKSLPKKRKGIAKAISLLISFFTAVATLVYGYFNSTVIECQAEIAENKTATNTCYRREEKETYPVLFNLGLGLLGIILAAFMDRLYLVIEELFHFQSRYNRNIRNLFKECFSGIPWRAVGIVTLVLVAYLLIPFIKNPTFELRYIVYILSGIGVGPLVTQLLNLNSQSEVQISTFLEQKGIHIGDILAWYYYYNYLVKALSEFEKSFPAYFAQGSEDQRKEKIEIRLQTKKLILLIPLDCVTEDDLSKLDDKIEKIVDISSPNEHIKFPVYSLTNNEDEKQRYAIQYAKDPLEVLREMYIRTRNIEKLTNTRQVAVIVTQFCNTLSSILENPLTNPCFRDMCILVPVEANTLITSSSLIEWIETPATCSGIMSEKGDNLKETRKRERTVSYRKAIHPGDSSTNSDKVRINPAEGNAQYNTNTLKKKLRGGNSASSEQLLSDNTEKTDYGL